MVMLRAIAFLAILAGVTNPFLNWVTAAHAEIYKYTDENGVACYTDVPSGKSEMLNLGPEGKKPVDETGDFSYIVKDTAGRYGLDPSLIHAVITAESNYNQTAVSRKGAIGLMQLMPSTASLLGVKNPFHPEQNIEGGTRYLRALIDKFGGNLTLALAAYNAGPAYVKRYGNNVPPIRETRDYVRKVLALYTNGDSGKAQTGRPSSKPAKPVQTSIYKLVLEDGTIVFTDSLAKPSGKSLRF